MADSSSAVDNGGVGNDEVVKKEIVDVDTKPDCQMDKDKLQQIMQFLEMNGLKVRFIWFFRSCCIVVSGNFNQSACISSHLISQNIKDYQSAE